MEVPLSLSFRRRLALGLAAIALALPVRRGSAQTIPPAASAPRAAVPAPRCACPAPGSTDEKPGVVWRGADPHLTLDQVARLVAPILWFSSDEPLLLRGDVPIPRAHPCDRPSAQPVVYYQARRIELRGDAQVGEFVHADPRFFDRVQSVTIRFFFYYPEDIGFSGHEHDLEGADFQVSLDSEGGCGQVRLESVVAFAHGVDWYFNRLVVASDTRLPLTLLVEEGKHASAPDRNADGIYTPGYDVNRRVNDAWGIRDVLGSGFLGGAPYSASMTKQRHPPFRVLPPPANIACVSPARSSIEPSAEHLSVYQLRPAATISIAACSPSLPGLKELRALAKGNQFGAEHPARQGDDLGSRIADPVGTVQRLVPSIALRYDRALGLSFTLAGFDLRLVYLVPKINWISGGQWSFESMFTTSAARIYSPYLSLGATRELIPAGHDWRFVSEAGMRFRYRLSGWQRILGLGYQFAGVRLGIRASGFDDIGQFRFVFEVGAGAF